MTTVENPKCSCCGKVKEPSKFKLCEKCREYARQYHMANRDRKNERRKQHHEQNKEHDKERWARYYAEKKDEINERRQADRANNPEKYREQAKKYREQVKDIIITCPVCNYDIKKYKKSQHEKSQCHQDNLKKINSMNPATTIEQGNEGRGEEP